MITAFGGQYSIQLSYGCSAAARAAGRNHTHLVGGSPFHVRTFVISNENDRPSRMCSAKQQNFPTFVDFIERVLPFVSGGPRIRLRFQTPPKPQQQETGELASVQPAACPWNDLFLTCPSLVRPFALPGRRGAGVAFRPQSLSRTSLSYPPRRLSAVAFVRVRPLRTVAGR